MKRRSFLRNSLAVGVAAMSGLRATRGGIDLLGTAEAAPGLTPYPVLLITLRGGLDPALHLVATPNGGYQGGVTIANRMSGTAAIKTTPSGIKYFTGTIAAAGKADFEPHLGDVALLRGVKTANGGGHPHIAAPWLGFIVNNSSVSKKPWANYVASQFRKAGVFVPKPVGFAYPTIKSSLAYLDMIAYGNQSPDPACAAERILSYGGFFDSLASTGLPPLNRQEAVYGLAHALDGITSSPAQPDLEGKFQSARTSADLLAKTASSGPAWPPPPGLLGELGLAANDLTRPLSGYLNIGMLALAFQALSKNLSHVIAVQNGGYEVSSGGWDTHDNNFNGQVALGQYLWPRIGKLVAKMKATPSPIVPNKSLFDTTNIWIQSEMGRAATPDLSMGNTADGAGHWEAGACAMFLGGRFKRGVAIGGLGPDWKALPINPATGATGGTVMTIDNLVSTVIKASGADPAGFSNAAPIDALLDMSL